MVTNIIHGNGILGVYRGLTGGNKHLGFTNENLKIFSRETGEVEVFQESRALGPQYLGCQQKRGGVCLGSSTVGGKQKGAEIPLENPLENLDLWCCKDPRKIQEEFHYIIPKMF